MKKAADAEKKAARAKPAKVGGGGSKTTRKGRDNGTCSLARSFGASTLVLMADGTRKPIKDVRIGDWVLATDPVTGEQVAKRVTHLWVHHDDLTELVLNVDADRDGVPDRLVTTEDHPFWNATDAVWEGPEEFSAGDEVVDEQWNRIEVAGLDPGTTRRDLAYNLTVEGIHTYHVGAADILVHNCGGKVEGHPESCTCGINPGAKLPPDRIQSPPPRRGSAPIGDDGRPVELHHTDQSMSGPVDEMTRFDHRGPGNYSANHTNTGERPSAIDRREFDRQRSRYWESEWDSGRWSPDLED